MKKYLALIYKSSSEGFTLIELLIVMIIIGLLSALVAPKMFQKVGTSRAQATKAQISLFETALDTYRLDNRSYPSSEQGLQALVRNPGGEDFWDGPYLKKIPADPWGREYVYSCDGTDSFTVLSRGEDGVENTDDDISNMEDSEGAPEGGDVIPPG